MDSSARALKRLYNRLNKKYWNNNLPADVVCIWRPCDDAVARTWHFFDEHGKLIRIEIWIDPKLEAIDSAVRAAMLHEMCHVEVHHKRQSHGIKWEQAMDRLWTAR